jgi:acetyl-CoA C-acetyltransferase
MSDPIVILGASRTAIGAFQGVYQHTSSPHLGAVAIRHAIKRAGLTPHDIKQVTMGCVLSAGIGQAGARQAAIYAECEMDTTCVTVNKVCGSGLFSVMMSANALQLEDIDFIAAGGMENMTRAPYLLQKARSGYRLGNDKIIDSMFLDGLEDAYHPEKMMGHFAQETANTYGISRDAQDQYAIESLLRAQKSIDANYFHEEIAPVTVYQKNLALTIEADEIPGKVSVDKIPLLKPAFGEQGTITAANASGIADGAAAVVLSRLSIAEHKGLTPLAKIIGYTAVAKAPQWFTIAPIDAVKKLLEKINWKIEDVDLFEINEAFAVVVLIAMQELNIPREKVNVHGGACALGHPIGASGARILVTLIHALKQRGLKRGIATLCIGGGEAVAMAVEII